MISLLLFSGRLGGWVRAQGRILLFLAGGLSLVADEHHAWSVDDLKPSSFNEEPAFEAGRRPDVIFSRESVHLLAEDTRALVTAPLHWDRGDWLLASGLTGLIAASAVFDNQIQNEAQETASLRRHTFTKRAQSLGGEGSWLILGAFESYGYLADNTHAKAVAMDGLIASIIASGVITPLVKLSVGRVRPDAADSTFEFQPFSGNYSFPSGHTTQAFAVASVIAEHYDEWWIKGLSYGLASMVGYARIEQNDHYMSDVVAGAIIGTMVGRAIVKRHNQRKEGAFNVIPYFTGQESGIQVSKNF